MSILDGALAQAPSFSTGLTLCLLTAMAYLAPAIMGRNLNIRAARWALITAWALHAVLLVWIVLVRKPLSFGFAPALSMTVWIMLTVYTLESKRYPQLRAQQPNALLRWMAAICGAIVLFLALIFPGERLPPTISPLLPLHWALGITAYGVFAAAVVHAFILSRSEARLRHAALPMGGLESSLPLLTQERLMFGFVWAGFILLTLTLVAGVLFGEQLYGTSYLGWRWDHKRVFTVLSWLIIAALLLGRLRFGWRGRRAMRMLYIGAMFLLLGYAGSRFVFEVLLHRAV